MGCPAFQQQVPQRVDSGLPAWCKPGGADSFGNQGRAFKALAGTQRFPLEEGDACRRL